MGGENGSENNPLVSVTSADVSSRSFEIAIAYAQQCESFCACRCAELPTFHPPPDGCRFEERIPDLERSLPEERRGLRQADALYRRLAFRRFEQTLFAQPSVFAAKRKQFVVRSALDDTAAIKHENLVCAYDSGKPVRDYNGRAIEHQSLQRFLDESLRRGVHARRCFIQNQNWRIF